MPKYINDNYKDRDSINLGPYTVEKGVYETDESNDSTVGHILTTYYGFRKILSDEDVKKAEDDAIAAQQARAEFDKKVAEQKAAEQKTAGNADANSAVKNL